MKTEDKIKYLFKNKKLTISAAESCSGGNISHLITSVPGASNYFKGSVVSYSAEIKESLLGVPASLIQEKGIVSREVAAAMSEGVLKLMKTDYSVSITGWADIYGDEHEPAGTAWVGVSSAQKTKTFRLTSLRKLPSEDSKDEEKISYRKANISHFSKLALQKLIDFVLTE